MLPRVVAGRARVIREIRAAGPLMAALAAPVPARGPWLTAVLTSGGTGSRGRWPAVRPVAVVVEPHRQGRPEALALLHARRAGVRTEVTMLGAWPLRPDGCPPARLLARTEGAADRLGTAVGDLLVSLRGPWVLRLTGLPPGDPTLAALADRLPTAVLGAGRGRRLVDELDGTPGLVRSRDPRVLERWLPSLLAHEPDRAARAFLRTAARLHAAVGELETAVVADGERLVAGVLTLLDEERRWPWWATPGTAGLRTEPGAALAGLTARG